MRTETHCQQQIETGSFGAVSSTERIAPVAKPRVPAHEFP
jgi:hypothetical protein